MFNETNVTGLDRLPLPVWHSPYPPVVQGLIWLVALVLSVETVVGNAMVLIAYKLERSISKQISNRYIISLAASDLIIGLEGIPLFTIYVVNGDRWPLGSIACDTWLFLDYSLCLVSILTVLLITVDRYMSVVKTPQYVRWQSVRKTKLLIVISWVVSALIFGVMIYLWPYFNVESSIRPDDECYAPFLANPYVNMSLYIIYYWTTLIAMLILYKGIHKAAKNLEKKAKAKEHRHIALLLTQRLGTQVGVSLMLQSKRADSLKNDLKDSGYNTNTNNQISDQPETINQNEKLPPLVKLRREPLSLKRSISPGFSRFSFRRRSKRASIRSVKSAKLTNSSILDNAQAVTLNKYKCPTSASMIKLKKGSYEERRSMNLRENTTTIESLSTLFHDESLSSILQFNSPTILESPADPTRSETTSIILSRRLSHRSQQTTSMLSIAKSEEAGWLPMENVAPLVVQEKVETPQENGEYLGIGGKPSSSSHNRPKTGEHSWFRSFRHRLRKRTRKRSGSQRMKSKKLSRSVSSSSSESSSADESNKWASKIPIPSVTVTREKRNKPSDSVQSPEQSNEPFLGTTLGVTRKISNISTAITKERMISSLLSPIAALNRNRKRTKAERRAHKAFRTITFIVGLFAILWSPYYIVATVYGFCKGECIPAVLYNLSYYLCYLNSSGNPFAYALANRQFRSAFLRILKGNFKRVS